MANAKEAKLINAVRDRVLDPQQEQGYWWTGSNKEEGSSRNGVWITSEPEGESIRQEVSATGCILGWILTAFLVVLLGQVLCPSTDSGNLSISLVPAVAIDHEAELYNCYFTLLSLTLNSWGEMPRIDVWMQERVSGVILKDKRLSGDYGKLKVVKALSPRLESIERCLETLSKKRVKSDSSKGSQPLKGLSAVAEAAFMAKGADAAAQKKSVQWVDLDSDPEGVVGEGDVGLGGENVGGEKAGLGGDNAAREVDNSDGLVGGENAGLGEENAGVENARLLGNKNPVDGDGEI
uniref:Uncharacterized protein n=1 Tax=Chenopodium quinoa TaxID=63459 RepID=A0A803N5U8_CHEQI